MFCWWPFCCFCLHHISIIDLKHLTSTNGNIFQGRMRCLKVAIKSLMPMRIYCNIRLLLQLLEYNTTTTTIWRKLWIWRSIFPIVEQCCVVDPTLKMHCNNHYLLEYEENQNSRIHILHPCIIKNQHLVGKPFTVTLFKQNRIGFNYFLVYHFRYRKKGVANSSGIQNLQYVGQLIDWNAKTCPKKSVGKSLTRSANKYLGKSVNKPRNQNVNKFVSLCIGAKFVNCDLTTFYLYKNKCVPFFVLHPFINIDKVHYDITRWSKTPKLMSSYLPICCLLMNILNLCIT